MKEKNKKILKNLLIVIICIFCCSCSIHFNLSPFDNYDYYDSNLKYIEEENKRLEEEKVKKEAELKKKIESRNYIDERLNGYFGLLNNNERQIYYDIYENANNFNNDFFDLTYRVSIERLQNIFRSVVYDNPDLFWLKTYWYYKDQDTKEVYSVMLIYYDRKPEEESSDNIVDFVKEKNKVAIEENQIKKEQFNIVVNNIVNIANNYNSVLEKEKYVHDFLVNNITYDENMHSDQSPYGALIYNKSVCAGYAKAFQLIMKKLNIPTFYISGEAWDEKGQSLHAWNLIQIDNEYYNIDVTWDDPVDNYYGKNRIRYTYFNVSDEVISKNHLRGEISTNLPNALGTKYSNLYK